MGPSQHHDEDKSEEIVAEVAGEKEIVEEEEIVAEIATVEEEVVAEVAAEDETVAEEDDVAADGLGSPARAGSGERVERKRR